MADHTALKKSLADLKKEPAPEKVLAKFVEAFPVRVTDANEKMFKIEDKKILESVLEALQAETEPANLRRASATGGLDKIVLLLETIRRLLLSKVIFKSLVKANFPPIIECLKSDNPEIVVAALNAVSNVVHFNGHTAKSETTVHTWEQNNKSEFSSAGGFTALSAVIEKYVGKDHPQIGAAIMRLFAVMLTHKSKSTSPDMAKSIVSALDSHLPTILTQTFSQDPELRYSASLLVPAVLFHSGLEATKKIQDQAMSSGAVLYLLNDALFPRNVAEMKDDPDWIDPEIPSVKDASRDVFGHLCDNNSEAIRTIFRVLPKTFQNLLLEPIAKSSALAEAEAEAEREAKEAARGTEPSVAPSVSAAKVDPKKKAEKATRSTPFGKSAPKSSTPDTPALSPPAPEPRESRAPSIASPVYMTWLSKKSGKSNWTAVFHAIDKDQVTPCLIWNAVTREDLREGLQAEINLFQAMKAIDPHYTWDYDGFEIQYKRHEKEFQVDGYFLRLLIPGLQDDKNGFHLQISEVAPLMMQLYNRAVVEDKATWKLACLRAISALYNKFTDLFLTKRFDPLPYLTWLLDPVHTKPLFRDHILDFMLQLLTHVPNARVFLQRGGLDHLIYYLAQVHVRDPVSEEKKEVEPEFGEDGTPLEKPKEAQPEVDPNDVGDEHFPYPKTYNKYEVADRVILLLTLLLGKVARLKKRISTQVHFQHMVQFLLCDRKDLSAKMIPLVASIIEDSPWIVENLVKTGLFRFLLYAVPDLPAKCYTEIFKVIGKYHRIQNVAYIPKGESALKAFLPSPMERLLAERGFDAFTGVFNSSADEAHLLWDQNLRGLLADQIKELCEPFKVTLSSAPLTTFTWEYPPKIAYPPIDKEICVGTMYLRLYNERKGAGYSCSFPDFWCYHLVRAMDWELNDQDLSYLLDAQRTAIIQHAGNSSFQQYQFFVQLSKTLVRKAASEFDVYLVQLASDCLLELLTLPAVDAEHPPVNPHKAFADSTLLATNEAILHFVTMNMEDERNRKVLQDLLKILDTFVTRIGDPSVPALVENRPLLREIVKLTDQSFAAQYPHVTIQALTTLQTLTNFADLRQCLLENGGVLFLINLSIFFPYSKSAPESPGSLVVEFASHTLSGLAGMHPRSPQGLPVNEGLRKVFRKLITPGLHRELNNPAVYIESSRTDSVNPILIWNESLRNELQKYLVKEIAAAKDSGTWEKWQGEPFEFSFEGLSKEIVVDDVYVYVYNKDDEFKIPNEPEHYMEALLIAIQASAEKLNTEEAKVQEFVEYQFHYNLSCSIALTRLINWYPTVLQSANRDFFINILSHLFEHPKLDPNVIQTALIILKQMTVLDSTTHVIVTPFRHVLHRVLNLPRADFSKNPQIVLVMEILLELTVKNPSVNAEYLDSGLIISLLYIITHVGIFWPTHRVMAAKLIGILCTDAGKGEGFVNYLHQLLANTFQDYLIGAQKAPEKLVKFFDLDSDSPPVFWTENCRKDLLVFLSSEMEVLKEYQRAALKTGCSAAAYTWKGETLRERFYQQTIVSQLCVNGIYVNAFNANPYHQVDGPKFFGGLIDELKKEALAYHSARESENEEFIKRGVANLVGLWEAVKNLITNEPSLQDEFVPQLPFLLGFFDPRVHMAIQEMVLKITTLLSTNAACATSIAKSRLVARILPLLVTMKDDKKKILSILQILLDIIRRSNFATLDIKLCGGVVLLLDVVLNSKRDKTERRNAAQVINEMIKDSSVGIKIAEYTTQILTKQFKEVFSARPERFVQFVDEEHESLDDERNWTDDTKSLLQNIIANESITLAATMLSFSGSEDLFEVARVASVWSKESKE